MSVFRRMPGSWRARASLACRLLLTFHLTLLNAPAAPPDRREIWVPTTQLKSVLDKNPRAVLLTKEQYDTLLRDAGARPIDPTHPPIQSVVQSADYTSTLDGQALRTIGKLTVVVLTDDWTVVPLQLDGGQIAQVQVDGSTAVRVADKGLQLIVHGKGQHTVSLETVQPITSENGASTARFSLPATSAGSLKLILAPDVTAPGMVVHSFSDRTEILHAFAGPAETYTAQWHPTDPSGGVAGSLSQDCSYFYQIDSASIHANFGITLTVSMGRKPDLLHLPIPPNCKIVDVVGDDIASWTIEQAGLTIHLTSQNTSSTTFKILTDTPLPKEAGRIGYNSAGSWPPVSDAVTYIGPAFDVSSSIINQPVFSTRRGSLELPFLTIDKARRISGVFGVIGTEDTAIRVVYPGVGSHPVANNFAPRIESDPSFAGAWHFDSQPPMITLDIAHLSPTFDADLDTGIDFQQDGIHLDRTITLHERDGAIFTLRVHLPADEQFIALKDAHFAEADYRQEGDQLIIAVHDSGVFHLQTRVEPPNWPVLSETGHAFSLSPLVIESVGKISGYLAINADASFRVETVADEGLEPRDGRITPVKGDFAWFGRGTDAAKGLKLRVTRRSAEISAQVAGYALPTANTLEINAHIDFQIARSGVRTLRIRIPGAENFHLEGPGIAERTLGGEKPDEKDVWTVTFQKEQSGSYGLQVTGQIPMTRDNTANDKSSDQNGGRFHVTVPTIEPLDAPRFGSTWAIEANTDTEIRFESSGLNELDNLRAPAITDYTPRHRVIGVFGSLGAGGMLTLRGERHAAATLPTVVVDGLDLTSILSTSGQVRHQATLTIRNAGEQFLEVHLPSKAKLWSLAVDGQPVKPVESGPDAVRIALPQQDSETPLKLGLVYETGGREWSGSGSQDLVAPKLDHAIPILRSKWTVWLPDGQSYEKLSSNLQHQEEPSEDLLVARLWAGISHGTIAQNEPDMIATEAGQFVSSEAPTSPNMPSIQQGYFAKSPAPVARERAFRTAGLLPLSLNLDPVGKPVVFEGAYAAETVHVSHLDWWSRGQRMWIWLVLGGVMFVFLGGRKPFRSLLWGILIFTFIPVCVSRGWTLECNGLLAGWMASFVGILVYRYCKPRVPAQVPAMEREGV